MVSEVEKKETIAADAQHLFVGMSQKGKDQIEFMRTGHPDAQWFSEAGLGLFIHFGISSLHGKLDLSWGMIKNTTWDAKRNGENKVTPFEYFKLAESFNPQNYNPENYLKAAADAGFKYAVFTTRHCDGYSMWPSKAGNFGTRTHMNGRDLVKSFVEACRNVGLKAGLYYSPADWYFSQDYMSFNFYSNGLATEKDIKQFIEKGYDTRPYGIHHQPVQIKEMPVQHKMMFQDYVREQIFELLTWYGKIDVLWFDAGGQNFVPVDEIRALQPGIVINDRMVVGIGDFETPECTMPSIKPAGWWERCDIWCEHAWGFEEPGNYKATSWMLSELAKVRAWDGNFLVNCAPAPNGDMPPMYYKRMEELGEWMRHSRESVFNVNGGPYPEKCNVPVTMRENTYYLHSIDNTIDDIVATGIGKPSSVRLLRTNEDLPHDYYGEKLIVRIPVKERTQLDDVIKLEL